MLADKGGRPPRTSRNSHQPPSKDQKADRGAAGKNRRRPRPSRPGSARLLATNPDRIVRQRATSCRHCGGDVGGQGQACRHRYDRIDIPLLAPEITRIELFGGRCGHCGKRFEAEPPAKLPPGTPFGPNIHALLLYLHHSHHVGFERLSRLLAELFGLSISEGAIAPTFEQRRFRPNEPLFG